MDSYAVFTQGDNILDLQVSHVRFGGDLGLQDRPQRLTEHKAQQSEGDRKG